MANWFAIHKISNGEAVSFESDDAQQRLTDAELAAKGLARAPVQMQPDADGLVAWDPVNKVLDAAGTNQPLSFFGALLQKLGLKS